MLRRVLCVFLWLDSLENRHRKQMQEQLPVEAHDENVREVMKCRGCTPHHE